MSSDDEVDVPNGDKETPPKAPKSNRSASNHPKYSDMLIEAIKALDEKKGASVIAIKQWIIQSYPEVDQSRMKNLLRMAIKRGVESGAIVRPKKSEAMGTALTGRYKLGKPPKPAKKVEKKKLETKKARAAGKKKRARSPTAKKDRKKSDHDIFDYEDDTEGSDPDGGKTPPPYRRKGAKKQPADKPQSKKVGEHRPRSSSANATPKPRVSKSKAIFRRSKSQSPAPSKIKNLKKAKKPASKSPAKKSKSKSPAKKPKAKVAASKTSPAAGKAKAKAKKPVAKKDKTPIKKAANKITKKKTTK